MVYHWEFIISSSYFEPKASSSSSPPSEEEDSLVGSGEGKGVKPPSQDWPRAMRLKLLHDVEAKINTHVLKLLHDVSKGDSSPIWGRGGRGWRRSNGRGCKIYWGCIRRLHLWPLCSKLCCTPPNRLLINGTHDKEVRNGRDGDVQVCKDTCDGRRKDNLITCSRVTIAIYHRLYHVWRKVYRKTFHEGKKNMSMMLSDGVIMRPWSKYKGHHHIKDLWTLSKLNYG